MNNIRMIIVGLVVITFAACQKEEFKLEFPESGITLSQPLETDLLDLNNEDVLSYKFTCNEVGEGGNTLILSASPLLKDKLPVKTVTIDMGDKNSIEIDVVDADMYFSSLGVGGGKIGTLYWTVKPTKDLTVAATEIRPVTVKRIQTQLIVPEDQAAEVLNIDMLDKEVTFAWQVENEESGTEYQLCFALDSRMQKEKVVVDAGNAGEFNLTYQQLQDIIMQLPITLYSQNNIYWNVIRKSDGSFISRASHILKLNDMMIFTDIRGDEKITYRVTKIKYSTGEEVIWLAENLRATKFIDGTEISLENKERWDAPTKVSEEHQKAYGYYYSQNIKGKIVPKGWKMPSKKDYSTLLREARLTNGKADVLKDKQYWNWGASPSEYANAWGFGMTACGGVRWLDIGVELYNEAPGGCTCYFLTADLDAKVANFTDWGTNNDGEVYESEGVGAAVRLIYVGQ